MKYFLIVWLCINDPNISLENTCQQLILDQGSYDTMLQCTQDARIMYEDVKAMGNIYLTSFCSMKPAV